MGLPKGSLEGPLVKEEALSEVAALEAKPTKAPSGPMFSGSTLISKSSEANLVKWGVPSGTSWQLCYKMAIDGATSSNFHSKCDGKGPTVTVVKLSTGKTVGGYATKSWKRSGYNNDPAAFLFSLTNSFKHTIRRANYAQYSNPSYLPTFGGGHDLTLHNRRRNGGYCNLGHSYNCRTGSQNTASCRNDFCGSYNTWEVQDVEVFVGGKSDFVAATNVTGKCAPCAQFFGKVVRPMNKPPLTPLDKSVLNDGQSVQSNVGGRLANNPNFIQSSPSKLSARPTSSRRRRRSALIQQHQANP
jgi:hypothetical protein